MSPLVIDYCSWAVLTAVYAGRLTNLEYAIRDGNLARHPRYIKTRKWNELHQLGPQYEIVKDGRC